MGSCVADRIIAVGTHWNIDWRRRLSARANGEFRSTWRCARAPYGIVVQPVAVIVTSEREIGRACAECNRRLRHDGCIIASCPLENATYAANRRDVVDEVAGVIAVDNFVRRQAFSKDGKLRSRQPVEQSKAARTRTDPMAVEPMRNPWLE